MTKKLALTAAIAALAALAPAASHACDDEGCPMMKKNKAANAAQPSKTTVSEVAAALEKKQVVVLDANNAEFREKNGVITGATLLTSFNNYDVAKELPAAKDSKLVFYCAQEKCGASHMAAERAMKAGYANVSVMPEGLMGWKKAGKPTSNAPRS